MEEPGGSTRRDLIKKGAVAGGLVWIAPAIVSVNAASAASVCTNPFTLEQNFFGLPSGGQLGYQAYGPGAALVGGWVVTPVTTSIDAVTYNGPFGGQGWTDTAPSPLVIIDLAGTPGPGGITTTVEIECVGTYTIAFERSSNVPLPDHTTLTVDGTGVTPTSTSWGSTSGAVVADSLVFTTTAPNASVTITFATALGNNGNTMVTNISIA